METKNVLVLGNGESRRCLDLTSVLLSHTTVGCNAIYRDHTVDHLICCDRRMATEAVRNIKDTTKIYTRSNWASSFSKFPNVSTVPELPYKGDTRADDPFQWGSGQYAVLLACLLSDNITLIGFDLWSNDNYVNNVYKDTENYSKANSHSVDPNYWIYQTEKIFKLYPNKSFNIYNNIDWNMPSGWNLHNVVFHDIKSFKSDHE